MQTNLFDLLGNGTVKDLPTAWDDILNALPPFRRGFFQRCCRLKDKKEHQLWIEVTSDVFLPIAFKYLRELREVVNNEFEINS